MSDSRETKQDPRAVRLEMSRPHARAVSEATEILSRLGAGQVEVLVDMARSGLLPSLHDDPEGLVVRLDRIRAACNEIKAALGLAHNENLGIGHPRTAQAGKLAFEVKKSLDRTLALDSGNHRGAADISLDGNIVGYSGVPFPATTIGQSVDSKKGKSISFPLQPLMVTIASHRSTRSQQMTFGEFNQHFEKGERAILKSEFDGDATIVTIDGTSSKNNERIYNFGSTWARPEDFKKVDQDLLALLDDAYDGLREYHPEQMTEDARAAIYLSVLEDGRSKGQSGQLQYETLRDLVEAEAERIQAEQNAKSTI